MRMGEDENGGRKEWWKEKNGGKRGVMEVEER